MTFKHQARRSPNCWIIVADRAQARILAGKWPELSELSLIEELSHLEGAAHPRDVETDTQGRFYEGEGPKHKADAGTDFKHKTALEFAHEIVATLEQGKSENRYGRLVLIAPALFLGVLRETLPEPLRRLLIADLDKHLVTADEATIIHALQEVLPATKVT
jgi:protein required for attachment to host cells